MIYWMEEPFLHPFFTKGEFMALLEMKDIHKAFGANEVLKDVSLSIEEGEVHALLGENGAGKSTLMNILTGVVSYDAGDIVFDGKRYPEPTIQMMEDAGIAFVHQELNVINDLTVSDNIFLNREIRKGVLLNKAEMVRKTQQLFSDLGVDIDPNAMVSELNTAEKQLLEICRALYVDAKLFVLDEPTTALSNDEIRHLFSIIRNLKKQKKSFIFISHKMPEIFDIADRYTVFRNGEMISSGYIKDTDPHAVTSDMVGVKLAEEDLYTPRPLGETVLELRHLSGIGFEDINLEIRKGEIVAFTGLAGCGASELMHAMFGSGVTDTGEILVEGRPLAGSVNRHMRSSLALLPSNRRENSVISDLSILENYAIAKQSITGNKPMINRKNDIKNFVADKEKLNIKAEDYNDSIDALSGGNKQKVFIGRWLYTGSDILLFDNPTQGVDVGAKAEIYKLILQFAQEGKTIIINTLEIPEIQKVADRCVIFYEGRIVKQLKHEEVNEHDVMLYSTSAINEQEEVC